MPLNRPRLTIGVSLNTAMKEQLQKVANFFKRIFQVIANNFVYFSQSTGLHGVRYMGNRNLPIFDRLFFFISFALILVYVITFTASIYEKWVRTPVIVGHSAYPTRINNFPFPTVTICNTNQIRASMVQNFSKNSVEYTMLRTICSKSADKVDASDIEVDIKNRTMFQNFIKERAQPCSQLLISCRYGRKAKNCSDIFKTVLTDEGLCCVFNAVHPSFIYRKPGPMRNLIEPDGAIGVNWDLETGYQGKLPKLFYPRVGTETGINMGLSITVNAEVHDYFCTSTNGPGFKLLLHNALETPNLGENGLLVAVGSENTFRIAVDRAEATQNIRSFAINDRQCVFKSERRLGFFKGYTKNNCELECLSNITEQVCGCTNFFIPATWTNARSCSLKDQQCQETILNLASELRKDCKRFCVQGCFDLSFRPDKFAIPLSDGDYIVKDHTLEQFNSSYRLKNIAVIHFYYKMSHFTGFMRTRFIGPTEFISNTGGLMGLLGFSFITVAELVYFVVYNPLRPLGSWISRIGVKVWEKFLRLKQKWQMKRHTVKVINVTEKVPEKIAMVNENTTQTNPQVLANSQS